MRAFQHLAPPLRLYSGGDSLAALARELDRLKCTRAVVVCGASLAREGSALALVRAAMGERHAGTFAGVRAHSPVPDVETAARELRALGADAVVAVGGGSAIVTARAASILLAENGTARDFCTTRDAGGKLHSPKLLAPKLPQLVVPTTPTTASVKAGSAVLDPETRERLALFDPKTRAQAVFVHPDLMATAPDRLVLSSSLNTLTLAVEGLMSRSGDPFSDADLMHALRLLAQHLPDPARLSEVDTRAGLMYASLLCGHGTDHTGAGVTTVLGHAIGARHHLENGVMNALMLPHGVRFNAEAARAALEKVATALGAGGSASPADAVVAALDGLFARHDLPRRLRDAGIARDSLADIAERSLNDWFLRGNARAVGGPAELQRLLEDAW